MAVMRYKKPDGTWEVIRGASGTGTEGTTTEGLGILYFDISDTTDETKAFNADVYASITQMQADNQYIGLVGLASKGSVFAPSVMTIIWEEYISMTFLMLGAVIEYRAYPSGDVEEIVAEE